MTKQITAEEIHKIQCLYYNQPIMGFEQGGGEYWMLPVFPHSEGILFVKPLSKITDEHCEQLSKIVSSWEDDEGYVLSPLDVPEWLEEILGNNCNLMADYVTGYQMIEVIDFLRTNSCALPAFGYTIPDLISQGVFKIVEP